MRTLKLLFLTLLFTNILASQIPLEEFDQSRCRFVKTIKLQIKSYPLEYIPTWIETNPNIKLPYSFWKLENGKAKFLKQDFFNQNLKITIPKLGTYMLIIEDVQNASLLLLKAEEKRLEVQFFSQCVRHY